MRNTLVLLLCLSIGCTTPGKPKSDGSTGNFTGPDAATIHEDVGNILAKVGERQLGYFMFGEHRWSYMHQVTKKGEPLTCTEDGCWAGMTKMLGNSQYEFNWPFGRKRGVVRHESMHAVIDTLERYGLIEPIYGDYHPDTITLTKNGKTINVKKLVNWRWPDMVNPFNEKENGIWDDYEEVCLIND